MRIEDAMCHFGNNEVDFYARMWVEDSLGRRYPVPGAEKYLSEMLAPKLDDG